MREADTNWDAGWEELAAARALIVGLGRPTPVFDALQRECGVARAGAPRSSVDRFRAWTDSLDDPPFVAVKALAAAVPESPWLVTTSEADLVDVRAKFHPVVLGLLLATPVVVSVVAIAVMTGRWSMGIWAGALSFAGVGLTALLKFVFLPDSRPSVASMLSLDPVEPPAPRARDNRGPGRDA